MSPAADIYLCDVCGFETADYKEYKEHLDTHEKK
jgi:hypothetical protein